MPLTPLAAAGCCRVIAKHRDPESYRRRRHRPSTELAFVDSDDIDIFHDGEERLSTGRRARRKRVSCEAGFRGYLEAPEPDLPSRVLCAVAASETRLEWVVDSEFRFFPGACPTTEFGYILHPLDLATNKILAAASPLRGSRCARSCFGSTNTSSRSVRSLGQRSRRTRAGCPRAIAERASVAKRDIRTTNWRTRICSWNPITAGELNNRLRAYRQRGPIACWQLCRAVWTMACLLRPDGSLAQPDADRPETLEGLIVHHGSRKGAWPSSPEIGSVMLRERR